MWTLKLSIQSNWFIGSGREAGAYADLIMLKDDQGMPFIPGRSIRGLLRNAFRKAAEHEWFGEANNELLTLLFGREGNEGLTAQGILQVSSANLAQHEYQAIVARPELKSFLYRAVTSTAIHADTGAALVESLRATEVAVPMDLSADISINETHASFSQLESLNLDLAATLDACAALITNIGGQRHRGLGHCFASVAMKDAPNLKEAAGKTRQQGGLA